MPLTGVSENVENSLKTRVASLEARVAHLEEELDRSSGSAVPPQFREAIDAIYGDGKKRPGPEEKIDQSELLQRRDNLVEWLEERWPEIVKPLLAAKNPRKAATVLKSVAPPKDRQSEWLSRFVAHPAHLWEFISSNRFRVRPPKKTVLDALGSSGADMRTKAANRLPTRQIANAMAGVPKLKWRRSLDRCSGSPSSLRVGYNTAAHYRTMFGLTDEVGP